MLKSFLVNQGVAAIEVEEKYSRFVAELRTDRYVTVSFSVCAESTGLAVNCRAGGFSFILEWFCTSTYLRSRYSNWRRSMEGRPRQKPSLLT